MPVRRLQLPVTPAYAFTDYRSQGQTIPAAIGDIITPPSGRKLTLLNIYVAQCPKDFDEKRLMQPWDHGLREEDRWLGQLDAGAAIRWAIMEE
ncbi:hypothetical protein FRC06_009662, partial [Ceratobasidium sp. 370]